MSTVQVFERNGFRVEWVKSDDLGRAYYRVVGPDNYNHGYMTEEKAVAACKRKGGAVLKQSYYTFEDIALDYDIDKASQKVGMTAGEAYEARPRGHVSLAYSVIGNHTILVNRKRRGYRDATISTMFTSENRSVESVIAEYRRRLELRDIEFTLVRD